MGYSCLMTCCRALACSYVRDYSCCPVVHGTWVHWAIFSGDFPSDLMLDRFYILHVLVLPGLILALIAAHFVGVVPET